MHTDYTTVKGTLGGTLLTVLATIDVQDLAKTIVLASLGALVSFFVSKFLQWCWRHIKCKKK